MILEHHLKGPILPIWDIFGLPFTERVQILQNIGLAHHTLGITHQAAHNKYEFENFVQN